MKTSLLKPLFGTALLAALLAAPSRPAARAAEPLRWSLSDAIAYGLEHNPDLAVVRSQIDEREQARAQVFSGFLPDLTLESGYTYIDNVPRIEIDFPLESPSPLIPSLRIRREVSVGAQDNYRTKIALNQLLFASGRVYYTHQAAKAQIESVRQQESATRLKTAQRTAEAYNGALIAASVAAVQREALAAARSHLEHVRHRYEAGAATRLELLRAEAEVSNLEPGVTEAEKGIQIALTRLRRAVGLPDQADLVLTSPLDASVEAVDERAELDQAARMRPELRAIDHLRSAAEDQALAERGAMLPNLALTGTFGYEKPYFSINEWEQNWTVGVGLRMPLFDGLEAYHGMQKARAGAETLRRSAAQTLADIETEVRTALLDLEETAVRIGTTQENQERARQILAIAEDSYVAGAATSLEVIDAQLAARRARLEHLKALYDRRIARVRLAAATGDLDAIGR
ncbi:MAG: TolC family protein [bacterium]